MSAKKTWCLGCLILAAFTLPLKAQPPGGHEEKSPTPSAEVLRKQLLAAEAFAREVAGKDEVEYQRLLASALKQIRAARPRMGAHGSHPVATKDGIVSPFAQARLNAQAKAAKLASIFNDPTWQKNNKRLFDDVMKAKDQHPARIWGGQLTAEGEFPDCVAVASPGMFCCTGTLIGPNVVLTAGHCGDGGCASRIYVGINSNQPDTKKIYNVKKAVIHEQYSPFTLENDLTLLILEKDVEGVAPRPIADTKDIDAAYYVRLVGFGYTELGIFGVQNKVDVAIASAACDCAECPGKYGCHKGKEMVAGGGGKDTCNGDSGGPAYIVKDGQLYLAGATSRATANSVMNCGDGGVYVRVDQYRDWITKTAQANGGKLGAADGKK